MTPGVLLGLVLSLFLCYSPCHTLDSGFIGRQIVTPYRDGAILEQSRQLLDSAENRVLVSMYLFQRRDFAVKLVDLAKRGLMVRVLIEPKAPGSSKTIKFFKQRGVRVGVLPTGLDQANHVKLLMVDGKSALLGSANWGTVSHKNREAAVKIQGSSVEFLEKVFVQDWEKATGEKLQMPKIKSHPSGTSRVRIVTDQDFYLCLLGLLNSAGSRITGGVYSFTNRRVAEALVQAGDRGARVKLVLEPKQTENIRNGRTLSKGGVPLRWVDSGDRTGVLHLKAVVVDSKITALGSANWSQRGFFINHEINAIIEDKNIAAFFEVKFDQDWEAGTAHGPKSSFETFGAHPKSDYEFELER